MSRAAESARHLAQVVLEAFGGEPRVDRFHDEGEAFSVDILTCEDRPGVGFNSYSTLTLHDSENLIDGRDVRVEIAGVAAKGSLEFRT